MSTDNDFKLEAKHIVYVKSKHNPSNDAVFVKEYKHLPDGTREPNLRKIVNFERDWYITKEGYRKHKDKKESESLTRLQKRSSNTATMPLKVAKALNLPTSNLNMRQLGRSQYIYGTDITPEALVKTKYLTTWKDIVSPNSIAVLDLETNVLGGRRDHKEMGDIISGSITFKDKAFLCYSKRFMGSIVKAEEKIRAAFSEHLGQYEKSRGIKLEIVEVETDTQIVIELLKRVHEYGADFVATWNMNFDVPKMIQTLERDGIDPAIHFSDPGVDPEFRTCNYIEGPANRIKADGGVMTFSMHERWHTLITPSKSYWICAMGTYAFLRKAKGNEKSYALDAILEKILGKRKLNFNFADGYVKLAWHEFMQKKYKIEYLIYNLFDCIGVELLDEKTKDLSISLSELVGASPYRLFSSTPKQLAEDLHFFFLKHGRVICCVSDKMADELDDLVIGTEDWIITLATHLVEVNGLKCIEDVEDLQTLIRLYVSDLDIRSAYPWGEIVMNASKGTTTLELIKIEGVSEEDRRRVGLNLSGGVTNAINYCETIHAFPALTDIYSAYLNQGASNDTTLGAEETQKEVA